MEGENKEKAWRGRAATKWRGVEEKMQRKLGKFWQFFKV